MPIKWNEHLYAVPPKFVELGANLIIEEYQKLDETWQFLCKPVAREILRKMEESLRKKGQIEKSLFFRPAKKQDAVLHLIFCVSSIIGEALQRVTIAITTTEDQAIPAITAATLEDQAGRPLAVNGDIGIGQNDRAQIS